MELKSFVVNFSFRKFIENNQSVELQVAKFLENILDKATHLKKHDMQFGKSQTYNNYIQQVWPSESFQNNQFVLPNIFPAHISGKPVQFKMKPGKNHGDTIHNNGKFEGFVFNTTPFEQAKTPEDADKHLETLKSIINHEVEHINNIGSIYNDEDWQGDDKLRMSMEYMSNPGEKRAHARQMAHLYSKKFPKEAFDLSKAQSIANSPELNNTHVNYFIKFADPNVWQRNVNQIGHNHPNPHHEVVNLTKQFLADYL